jgi:phosphoribosylglycinamide formyltransferase-1
MQRIVILISGRGSNMQALLQAGLPAQVSAVISDRPHAAGLAIAARHGIDTEVVSHTRFAERAAFDAALGDAVARCEPDLIVLAGFMRILGEPFLERFPGRLINIHPSLLPAFPGVHTHRRALAEGVKIHGCTVHFVTSKLDHGPIIVQAAVPVLADDTEQTLAARVLEHEHVILPQAVRWFIEGRLHVSGDRVLLAGAAPVLTSMVSPVPS